MKKIFLLFASALLSLGAMANVEFTFTRGAEKAATVTVPEGLAATMESNVAWLTGGAMTSRTEVLCPSRNTSQASGDNYITYTLTVSGLAPGKEFAAAKFTNIAVNSGGNLQPSNNVDIRHCNFTLSANDTEVASLTDQNIWIAAGQTDRTVTLVGTPFTADAEGNLTLVLKLATGTSNGGCFYGLTKIELLDAVHTFSADKVYYIRPQKAGETYVTEAADGKLSMANNDLTKYQFWRLIPTDRSHCYYIQNVVTKKYIAACAENATNNTQATTGDTPVEYYIGITASTINEIAGCYYMASTNWEGYNDEAQGPKCLNTGGSVGGTVVTYTAGPNGSGGYKKNSYWRFEETTDEYQRPVPPAHTEQTKALTVYFRPCGMVSNTYLTAANIGGVDPIAYTAAAKPGSFHVPFSKDRGAVVRGSDFNVSITLSSADDADLKANAYFDWNADGEFEATEPIILDGTAGTATVTVPAEAVSGDTRMRIRLNSNGLDYADDDVEGFVYDFNLSVVDATTERKVYVDVNGANNGTVALSAAGDSHVVGTQLTATATPKGNATFESWREGGVVVSTDAEYTFTVEDRNMTLKAYFTPNTGTPAQWDFTFNRTSDTEATVAVTRDGEAVEGVTATIAIAGAGNYLTAGVLNNSQNGTGYTNGMGILSINRNTDGNNSTEANPNKYILTITNDTEEAFAFSYAEFYGVGVQGSGAWQPNNTSRKRYFRVKYGDTTLDHRIVSINDDAHCYGKETVNGFETANMIVPAGGTYAIELAIYGGEGITGDEAKGCYYGLTKIALGAVPHYAVTVEGTEDAAAGVVYNETTYNEGSTLNATLSLAQSELAAAPVEDYLGSVALDKALGTILVTYQPCITTQWDITFTRTSTTEATASVTRGGEAVEGVTATIAMSTEYKTNGKLGSERTDLLCSTTNSSDATAETPIKYTLTITNNTDKICLFDYIEVSDVALNGSGQYQGNTVTRVRNFKVTYGGTTIGPEEREICNPAHSEGKEYPQGFGAKVSIPAKGTYTIVLEIYKIDHNNTVTNDIGTGCFYGLSKIALGNTAVSFGTTGYATLYAPIALTIPEGVTAYTGALEENNTWLTLTPIGGNTIPKEHAVILEGTAGNKFTLEAATEAGNTVSDNALKGQTSTVATPTTSGTVYTLQSYDENEDGTSESVIFRKYLGEKVNGGRAYLVIPEQAPAQAVRVRKSNTSTEVEMPTANGQQSTTIYDLQGRRVMNPTKGVYIVNGKKVIVK